MNEHKFQNSLSYIHSATTEIPELSLIHLCVNTTNKNIRNSLKDNDIVRRVLFINWTCIMKRR